MIQEWLIDRLRSELAQADCDISTLRADRDRLSAELAQAHKWSAAWKAIAKCYYNYYVSPQ